MSCPALYRQRVLPFTLFLVVPFILFEPGTQAAGLAEVQVLLPPDAASIGNEFIALDTSLNAPFGPRRIRNLRSGKELPIEGEDFVLELASGRALRPGDFLLKRAQSETDGACGKRLIFTLERGKLTVRMVTELRAGEWWATRWLEILGMPEPISGEADHKGAVRLEKVTLARWKAGEASGPQGPGKTVDTLGYPSGCGQVVHAKDLFFAVAHPAAENFAAEGLISCAIPMHETLAEGRTVVTPRLVIGAGEAGAGRRAFLGYIDATRPVPARMIFLVNDWYWKDKGRPIDAFGALARVKQETGVPVESFTLDDGWDRDWDDASGIWGRLNRTRFPGGWDALVAAGRPAEIGVSLWFGPIGGYGDREGRIAFGKKLGFETNGDRFCLTGPRYRAHVIESFSRWANLGMDYIKVDGFWPDCRQPDHGHPTDSSAAVAHMDSLMGVFAAWRRARPGLVVGYTSGSSPSPFWLQHADFVWRGGADDSHAGAGEPFDRHNTYLDLCLQLHRGTEMPVSGFVTFDIVQDRIAGNRDDVFDRGVWWLAARTSLHHDWYIQASDLTAERWRMLTKAARWAREHEKLFRFGLMVGGDPAKGEIYGFSSFDAGRGTLALRNPAAEPRSIEGTLSGLLDLPEASRSASFVLSGVFGETRALEGSRSAAAALKIELPPLAIGVWNVEKSR